MIRQLAETAEEVSGSGHIQSKATEYVTEWKVVLETILSLEATCLQAELPLRQAGLFTFHSAGVIQAA